MVRPPVMSLIDIQCWLLGLHPELAAEKTTSRKSKKYSPNGGLIVIYHCRKQTKNNLNKSKIIYPR